MEAIGTYWCLVLQTLMILHTEQDKDSLSETSSTLDLTGRVRNVELGRATKVLYQKSGVRLLFAFYCGGDYHNYFCKSSFFF